MFMCMDIKKREAIKAGDYKKWEQGSSTGILVA